MINQSSDIFFRRYGTFFQAAQADVLKFVENPGNTDIQLASLPRLQPEILHHIYFFLFCLQQKASCSQQVDATLKPA
jgi:hypothetical protein